MTTKLKSIVTRAVVLALAFFAGSVLADPGDVISFNVNQDGTAISQGQTTLVSDSVLIPAAGWTTIGQPGGGSKSVTASTAYNLNSQATVTLSQSVTATAHSEAGSNWAFWNKTDTPSPADAACAYLTSWASNRDRTCIVGWFKVENIPYEKYDVIAYFQGGTVMASGGRGSITVEGSAPAGFDPVRITNGNASFDSSRYYKPDENGVLSVDTGLSGSEVDSNLSSDVITQESLWGTRAQATAAYGVNAFKVENCTGSTFEMHYWARTAGVAALQIIDTTPASKTLTVSGAKVAVSDINRAAAESGATEEDICAVTLEGTDTLTFDEPLTILKAKVSCSGNLVLNAEAHPDDLAKFDFTRVSGGVVYNWLEFGTGMAINFRSNSGKLGDNDEAGIPRLTIYGNTWNNPGEELVGDVNAKMFAPDGRTVIDDTMPFTWSTGTLWGWGSATTSYLKGYLDDNNIRITAKVPFDYYDVYIICATDAGSSKFSPKTVNGVTYTADVDGKAVPGSAGWGMSQNLTPILGQNVMVVHGITTPNLEITSPKTNGRGCIAAIVIVKTHEVRDYTWEGVNGDWTDLSNWYADGVQATELPTEFDTVDFYSRSARTINLPAEGVTVKSISIAGDNIYQGGTITLADNGYGSTIKGTATLVFDGGLPDSSVEDDFQSANWKGMVWLKNKSGLGGIDFTKYGNSGSTIKCTGISGNFAGNKEFAGTVVLENGETGYALNIHDGSSGDGNVVTFDHLTGSGKILGDGGSTAGFLVKDWTGFTGDVELSNKTVTFGDTKKANVNKIIVNSGFAYTLVGQTWTANGGIQIDGTIGGTGKLASAVTFGLNATLDATSPELLTVNALPAFALTNSFVVASAPVDGTPVKVLAAAEGVTLAVKTYDTVPVIIVGDAEVAGTFQARSKADGIYLEKVSGVFKVEKSDTTVTASGLNANELANADGSSIVTITLTGEEPILVLDESIKGGDIKIVHEGGLMISAEAEPADLLRYDLRGVTGFIRYSWLAMKRVINLNFRDGGGSRGFAADDMTFDGLLAGNTPKASWINLGDDASNEGVAITNAWDAGDFEAVEIEGMTVGWKAKTVYQANQDIPVLTGYLDDGDANWPDGVTITLKDVPFEAYDVIVYYNTDMDDRVYPPVKVNGVAYTWDGEQGKTIFGSANWGETTRNGVAYGKNALRISDLSGDVKITTAPRDNSQNLRGCVPAIQIVEVEKKANSFVADTDADVRISELNAKVPAGYTGVFSLTLNGGDLIYDTDFVCGALFVNSTADMTIKKGDAEISDAELAKINLAKVDGAVTFEIPRVPLATAANGAVYTVGVGTEDAPTPLAYPVENGSMTLKGGVYYLDPTAGGATSTVSFVDATIFATNGQGFAVGMANFTLSGATTVTASKVILSEGDDDRIASLTLNDAAKIIVTGETIIDSNQSSIMFGHYDGPSTFTLNGNAEFLATNAQVLVGKTSGNHEIILNGGTFVAKGIKASSSANLTNTLNLAGTTLYLGEGGISSYSANTKIDVNVLEDTTIYATDPTIAITQPITIADGKTLTINAGTNTIDFASEVTGEGSIKLIAKLVNFGGLRDFTAANARFDMTEVEALGLTATLAEYGAGKATIVGIPEKFETIYFEANGEILELSVEDGKASYNVEPHISGEACWYDFTFTNTVTTAAGSMVEATLNCDHTAEYVPAGDDIAIRTYAWPWHLVNGLENLDNYAVTFVATMPQTLRTTAFYIGNDVADAGIQFATGNVKDEILVNYVTPSEVREITTLTVPNAAEAYHCYMIAKLDDHTFVVYLDGLKWKTISTAYDISTIKGGMQFGSDYGGRLQRLQPSNPQYYTNVKSDDPSAFKFMRIYNRLLSDSEIAAYQERYPYVDPNGASTRTLVAAEESWVSTDETTPWTYAKAGEAEQNLKAPYPGGAINLIENALSMVTLTNNLTYSDSYSAITVTGANGVRFVSESIDPYPIKISGLVTIGAPVEIEYGALDISGAPLMLGESGAITFDCTNFYYDGIYGEKFIQLTGETDKLDDGKIVIIEPLPDSGLKAEGLYDADRKAYGLKVTVDREAMKLFIPAGTTSITDDTAFENKDQSDTFLHLRSDDEIFLRTEETLAITNAALTVPIRKLTVAGTEAVPASLKLVPGWNYTDTVVVGTNGTYDVDGQDNSAVNLVLNGGTLANTGASTVLNHIGAWKIAVAADSTVNVPLAEDEESRVLHSLASGYGVFDYNLNTNTLTKTGDGEYCIVNGRFNSGKLVVAEGTLTIDTLVVTNGEDLAVEVREGAMLLAVNGDSRVSSIGGTVDYELLTPVTRFEDGAKIRFAGANYFKDCASWTFADGAKVTLDAKEGATFRWFKPQDADSEVFFPNAAAATMTPAFKRMMNDSGYRITEQAGGLAISLKPQFFLIVK